MNSIGHQSQYITRAQAAHLIDAAAFAVWQECKLTRILHINLNRLSKRPQLFLSEFTKLAGDWLRTKDAVLAYVWALEHPPGKSLNAHMLIHVPENLKGAFARKERGWLGAAGLKWSEGVLESTKIGLHKGEKNRHLSDGEYLVGLEHACGYLLKGCHPDICRSLIIDYAKQGTIYGKRIGVSESVGQNARFRAGYHPPKSSRHALIFPRRCYLFESPPSKKRIGTSGREFGGASS